MELPARPTEASEVKAHLPQAFDAAAARALAWRRVRSSVAFMPPLARMRSILSFFRSLCLSLYLGGRPHKIHNWFSELKC